ncbi:MAG: hypothetical protein A2W33_09720 [Chloroflexi bacterium RBG_16_52_11]|nr:MAG: hypothetical protein A2W33_09720 [Chloroflexi bacterium RBG_16_52_11]
MADEKSDEKEMEKREEKDEKSREEKSWDEKWRRDPISAIVWAILFIWVGVVLLADNLDLLAPWLDNLAQSTGLTFIGEMEAWEVILVGGGLIVLVEVIVRLLMPQYRRAVGGTIFFAILLISVGLGNVIGWEVVGPLIFIALGLSILARGLFGRK